MEKEITTYAEFYDFLLWCTDVVRPKWFYDWAGTPEEKNDKDKQEWFDKNKARIEQVLMSVGTIKESRRTIIFVELHHAFSSNGPCPYKKRKITLSEGSARMDGRITPKDILTDENLQRIKKKSHDDERER